MNRRSQLFAGVALGLGIALLWRFVATSGVSVDALLGRLARLRALPLLIIVAATGGNIIAGAEKWRLVEARLTGVAPIRAHALALSAIGAGLGQLIPAPLASALVRGAGNRIKHAAGARSGAFSSIWEQTFDLGMFALLLPVALAALGSRRWEVFILGAPLTAALTDRLIRPCATLAGRLLPRADKLFDPTLCLALYRLSVVRFATLSAITLSVAAAIDSTVPLAAIAAAIPPVGLAATASLVPAGLGVNEWSFTFILGFVGVAGAQAGLFVLMNRIVAGSIAVIFGAGGALAFVLGGRAAGGLKSSAPPA